MRKYLFCFLGLYTINAVQAQVGIGTSAPSSSSILDLTSTNKGLMLPRIADTGVVSSPSAGLFVYNMSTKSPAFHNGTSWRTLATGLASTDSITYTVTSTVTGFTNGTYPLLSANNGITFSSSSAFQPINITKVLDINSTGFARGAATGPTPGSMIIEIKFYTPGNITPNYSLKASTNVKITSYQVSAGAGAPFVEQISITPSIYGYKDWVNNISFAWNTNMSTVVAY